MNEFITGVLSVVALVGWIWVRVLRNRLDYYSTHLTRAHANNEFFKRMLKAHEKRVAQLELQLTEYQNADGTPTKSRKAREREEGTGK